MNGFFWDLTDFMVNLSSINQSMIDNPFKHYSITIWLTVIIIIISVNPLAITLLITIIIFLVHKFFLIIISIKNYGKL
jgi:hypothetical protein